MRIIELNIDKLKIGSVLDYITNNENNFIGEKIDYCYSKDADAKVIVKWRDNNNIRRQETSYIKIIDIIPRVISYDVDIIAHKYDLEPYNLKVEASNKDDAKLVAQEYLNNLSSANEYECLVDSLNEYEINKWNVTFYCTKK